MSVEENQNPIVPAAEALLAIGAGVVVATASSPVIISVAGVTAIVSMGAFAKDMVDYALDEYTDEFGNAYNAIAIKDAQKLACYDKVVYALQNQRVAELINENISRQQINELCR